MSYKTFTVHYYSYNDGMSRYEMMHKTLDTYSDAIRFIDYVVNDNRLRLISIDVTW